MPDTPEPTGRANPSGRPRKPPHGASNSKATTPGPRSIGPSSPAASSTSSARNRPRRYPSRSKSQTKPASPKESSLEAEFAWQLTAEQIPFVRELCFAPPRKWRFDFAFPAYRIAVEIEGGTDGFRNPQTGEWVSHGRHQSKDGIARDIEKYNAAARLGWVVFRYTRRRIIDGTASLELKGILSEWPNNQT